MRKRPSPLQRRQVDEKTVRAVLKEAESEANVAAIAKKVGIGERSVNEIIKGSKAISEIAKRIGLPRENGGIIARAAAGAAGLPKDVQRKIAKDLAGADINSAMKIVQACVHELEIVRRGRKPLPVRAASDFATRLAQLHEMVQARLEKKPKDARARAHAEVITVLSGQRKVEALYRPSKRLTGLGQQ